MTGFIQERYQKDDLTIFITVKSYNNRALDIYLKINLPYVEIEKKTMQIIQEFIKRGRVECFINIFSQRNEQIEIIFNKPVIKRIVEELKDVRMDSGNLVINLTEIPGVITINPSSSFLVKDSINFIEESIRDAIFKLVKEREREGREMEREILKMIEKVENLTNKIEGREDHQIKKIKGKIERNLRLLNNLGSTEEVSKEDLFPILRKIDITEEVIRIKSHIKELKKCIQRSEPVGKKMEFLALEIQREATSILSKSEDSKISSFSLQIKDYIEKIKEQLRNIE
jgi:uncharacterized protein (TIGR00255 family)